MNKKTTTTLKIQAIENNKVFYSQNVTLEVEYPKLISNFRKKEGKVLMSNKTDIYYNEVNFIEFINQIKFSLMKALKEKTEIFVHRNYATYGKNLVLNQNKKSITIFPKPFHGKKNL